MFSTFVGINVINYLDNFIFNNRFHYTWFHNNKIIIVITTNILDTWHKETIRIITNILRVTKLTIMWLFSNDKIDLIQSFFHNIFPFEHNYLTCSNRFDFLFFFALVGILETVFIKRFASRSWVCVLLLSICCDRISTLGALLFVN